MVTRQKTRFEIWSTRFVLMTYFFGFIWLTIWLKPDSEDFYEEDMRYDNGALVCPEEKTPHTDEHNGC